MSRFITYKNTMGAFMSKKISPRGRSVAMLLAASVLWSTSGFFIKLVDWHPFAIAGMRSAIALVPIMIAHGAPKRPKGAAQIGASVSYALTLLLFVSANKLTTAANAILLQYSMPVYVIILSSLLLKEKIRRVDLATVPVVLAGLVCFFFDKLDATGAAGNILSLLSGVTLAFMIVFLRMQKDGTPMNSVIWGNILTFAAGLPFILSSGTPDAVSWLGLLFLGIFQLGLSYVFYIRSIKELTTVELALIPIIEPLLNPLIVAAFTGETPGVMPIIGGAVVLAGVTLNLTLKGK